MGSLFLANNNYTFMTTALILLVALASSAGAADPYSLYLEISTPDEVMFERMSGSPAIEPAEGNVLVSGRIDHAGFFIDELSQITVETPQGEGIPLLIDRASIFREFGSVVSLLFAFEISESVADGSGRGFRILWGPSIEADNQEVERVLVDPGRPALYRQFRWVESLGGDSGDETPFSTIVVIADSTAEYHFLWYLLPMGLIFTLLTIRKTRARHTSA